MGHKGKNQVNQILGPPYQLEYLCVYLIREIMTKEKLTHQDPPLQFIDINDR